MKSQLLEDIGQSATLSLVSSGKVPDASLLQAEQAIGQERATTPVKPRSAFGVWRDRRAAEPVPEPTAIVEAPPVPVAPVSAAEAALQGPVFDIILSSPLAPQPDLIEPERTWIEPSVRRYLLCGSVVLAGVLIGAWLYGEKNDAGALAVVAAQVNAQPQIGKVVKRPAMGVKEFTLGTDGEVRVAPVVPATSPSVPPHAVPVVPPLVLLAPEKVAELVPAASAAPLPKRVRRVERAQVIAAPAKVERAKVAREKVAREKVAREKVERAKVDRAPERPVAREAEPGSAFAMKATLEACKNHGYQPAQCVKQACSVGKYGFVCRGK